MELNNENYAKAMIVSNKEIVSYEDFSSKCDEIGYNEEERQDAFDSLCRELNFFVEGFYFNSDETSLYLESESFDSIEEFETAVDESINSNCCFEFSEIENYNNGKRAVWHRI